MDVSVIIPSYNRSADLRRCLKSLVRQKDCIYEVIVVDDCSTDNTVRMLESEFPTVITIENSCNRGPGFARNVGIARSKGEFLFFIDSDTELIDQSQLARFLYFFDQHPEAGCVGGERRPFEKKTFQVYGRRIKMNGDSASVALIDQPGNYTQCDFLATCCCMVRRSVAYQVGGFDPYYGFGGEDKDFGLQVKALGYRNYIAADCAVDHFHSPRGRALDESYRYQLTRIRFVLKNYKWPKIGVFIFFWLSSILWFHIVLPLKLALYRLKGVHLVRENITGGFMLLKAVFVNVLDIVSTRKARQRNYLDRHEMEAYAICCQSDSKR